jgi:hypothetical protein
MSPVRHYHEEMSLQKDFMSLQKDFMSLQKDFMSLQKDFMSLQKDDGIVVGVQDRYVPSELHAETSYKRRSKNYGISTAQKHTCIYEYTMQKSTLTRIVYTNSSIYL